MSQLIFMGSDHLKNQLPKLINNDKQKGSNIELLIRKSKSIFESQLSSSDLAYEAPKYHPTHNYLTKLTIYYCNLIKNEIIKKENLNYIDIFYQTIYRILSYGYLIYDIANQYNYENKKIILPDINLNKPPFSTFQLMKDDINNDDFFISYLLKLFLEISLSNNQVSYDQIIFIPLIKNKLFSEKINIKNYSFSPSYFQKILFSLKFGFSNKKIYLADNCISLKELLNPFIKKDFIKTNDIWSKLFFSYQQEKINNCLNLKPYADDKLSLYLNLVLTKLLPFSLLNTHLYIRDELIKYQNVPIFSARRCQNDDVIQNFLGHNKPELNYIIEHGGDPFLYTFKMGQSEISKSNFVSSSELVSKKITIAKPLYIEIKNPGLKLKSLFYKYKSIFKYRRVFKKKKTALIVLNYVNKYTFFGPNPYSYKSQLQYFEATIKLIKKLKGKKYLVLIRQHPQVSDFEKLLVEKYNDIFLNCIFVNKNILLPDLFGMSDLVFNTYPESAFAQTLYFNKFTILVSPLKLWSLRPEFLDLFKTMVYKGAFIDSSDEFEFDVKSFNDYKKIFEDPVVKKCLKKINSYLFSYNSRNKLSSYILNSRKN